ncbi:MAG: 50S ribosomal protein L29 [Gemmataceae bacterium]
MKASELHGQSDEQLTLALRDTEKHLFQLRFQSATDRLETPSEMAKAKKDIARIKTEQRRRELAKMAGLSAEAVAAAVVKLEPKTEGPGKRRAKRAIARLAALTPAKGK